MDSGRVVLGDNRLSWSTASPSPYRVGTPGMNDPITDATPESVSRHERDAASAPQTAKYHTMKSYAGTLGRSMLLDGDSSPAVHPNQDGQRDGFYRERRGHDTPDIRQGAVQQDAEKTFWVTYNKEADAFDRERLDAWNKSLDVLLIFAGLFSAINTAFILEAYKGLQTDQAELTNKLLTLQLIHRNDGTVFTQESLSSLATPASLATSVNCIYFSSLFCSVMAAFGAVTAKQWLTEYASVGSIMTQPDLGRRRQRRYDGMNKWKFPLVMVLLPILLQTSLILFLVGTVEFLWPINSPVAYTFLGLLAITLLVAFLSIAVGAAYPWSPFQSLASRVIRRLSHEFAAMYRTSLHSLPKWSTPMMDRVAAATQNVIDHSFRPTITTHSPPSTDSLSPIELVDLEKNQSLDCHWDPDDSDVVNAQAVLWILEQADHPDTMLVALAMFPKLPRRLLLDMLNDPTRAGLLQRIGSLYMSQLHALHKSRGTGIQGPSPASIVSGLALHYVLQVRSYFYDEHEYHEPMFKAFSDTLKTRSPKFDPRWGELGVVAILIENSIYHQNGFNRSLQYLCDKHLDLLYSALRNPDLTIPICLPITDRTQLSANVTAMTVHISPFRVTLDCIIRDVVHNYRHWEVSKLEKIHNLIEQVWERQKEKDEAFVSCIALATATLHWAARDGAALPWNYGSGEDRLWLESKILSNCLALDKELPEDHSMNVALAISMVDVARFSASCSHMIVNLLPYIGDLEVLKRHLPPSYHPKIGKILGPSVIRVAHSTSIWETKPAIVPDVVKLLDACLEIDSSWLSLESKEYGTAISQFISASFKVNAHGLDKTTSSLLCRLATVPDCKPESLATLLSEEYQTNNLCSLLKSMLTMEPERTPGLYQLLRHLAHYLRESHGSRRPRPISFSFCLGLLIKFHTSAKSFRQHLQPFSELFVAFVNYHMATDPTIFWPKYLLRPNTLGGGGTTALRTLTEAHTRAIVGLYEQLGNTPKPEAAVAWYGEATIILLRLLGKRNLQESLQTELYKSFFKDFVTQNLLDYREYMQKQELTLGDTHTAILEEYFTGLKQHKGLYVLFKNKVDRVLDGLAERPPDVAQSSTSGGAAISSRTPGPNDPIPENAPDAVSRHEKDATSVPQIGKHHATKSRAGTLSRSIFSDGDSSPTVYQDARRESAFHHERSRHDTPDIRQGAVQQDAEKTFWMTYNKEADAFDRERLDAWNKSLDVLLIFAGLFSAINTAFILEAYKGLQTDQAELTNKLITLQLIHRNDGMVFTQESLFNLANPAPLATSVNCIYFSSLFCSVMAAFGAVTAKQWLTEYASVGSIMTQPDLGRRRQRRYDGMNKWRFPLVMVLLPILLQISLILFLVGTVEFLWPINSPVAYTFLGLFAITLLVAFTSMAIGAAYPWSPFQSLASDGMRRFSHKLAAIYRSITSRLHSLMKRSSPVVRKVAAAAQFIVDHSLYPIITALRRPSPSPVVPHGSSELADLEKNQELDVDWSKEDSEVVNAQSVLWILEQAEHPDTMLVALAMFPKLPRALLLEMLNEPSRAGLLQRIGSLYTSQLHAVPKSRGVDPGLSPASIISGLALHYILQARSSFYDPRERQEPMFKAFSESVQKRTPKFEPRWGGLGVVAALIEHGIYHQNEINRTLQHLCEQHLDSLYSALRDPDFDKPISLPITDRTQFSPNVTWMTVHISPFHITLDCIIRDVIHNYHRWNVSNLLKVHNLIKRIWEEHEEKSEGFISCIALATATLHWAARNTSERAWNYPSNKDQLWFESKILLNCLALEKEQPEDRSMNVVLAISMINLAKPNTLPNDMIVNLLPHVGNLDVVMETTRYCPLGKTLGPSVVRIARSTSIWDTKPELLPAVLRLLDMSSKIDSTWLSLESEEYGTAISQILAASFKLKETSDVMEGPTSTLLCRLAAGGEPRRLAGLLSSDYRTENLCSLVKSLMTVELEPTPGLHQLLRHLASDIRQSHGNDTSHSIPFPLCLSILIKFHTSIKSFRQHLEPLSELFVAFMNYQMARDSTISWADYLSGPEIFGGDGTTVLSSLNEAHTDRVRNLYEQLGYSNKTDAATAWYGEATIVLLRLMGRIPPSLLQDSLKEKLYRSFLKDVVTQNLLDYCACMEKQRRTLGNSRTQILREYFTGLKRHKESYSFFKAKVDRVLDGLPALPPDKV
ncbi:hypothetical protein FRB99_000865 [Tulasnella sp. 403]|nr:hypothetical protein FRB99_000865 [Tulasnella sp. 403]